MILSFTAKCSDCFGMTIENGEEILDHNGYVPYSIGIGGGDYVKMKIDVETGKIIGWNPEAVQKYFNEKM